MLDFEYSQPTKVLFGQDSIEKVGAEIRKSASKVMVLSYADAKPEPGNPLGRTLASLEAAGVKYLLSCCVVSNPRIQRVQELAPVCRKEGVDFILAVGGGGVIDTAKGLAFAALLDCDVWENYYMIRGRAVDAALPVGVVLTIPAAGSEGSPSSCMTDEVSHLKRTVSHPNLLPRFVATDPRTHMTLPPYQTACGICDIFSHLVERYFVDTDHVEFTDQLIEAAMRSLLYQAPKVMKDPCDYNARAEIAWIGTVAHNGILNTGRGGGDWASHFMGHELSAFYDMAHGATLAIMMPSWMRYVCGDVPGRFLQFAVRVMGVDAASFLHPDAIIAEGIDRLERFFHSLGLPVTIAEAGIPDDKLEAMAKGSMFAVGKIGSCKVLYEEDALKIFQMAYKK